MSEITLETAHAMRALWRSGEEDRPRYERRLWERWTEFRSNSGPVRESQKVKFFEALGEYSYVLLNPRTADLTRALWKQLRAFAHSTITHAQLAVLIDTILPADSDCVDIAEHLYGGLALFGYITPRLGSDGRLCYSVETGSATDETFRAQMFGFISSLPGFNDVFGGALLVQRVPPNEDVNPSVQVPVADRQMQGRLILVEGPFGIGKSVLTWRMAAEFAIEGGLVLMHAPEQSIQESLYSLAAVNPDLDLSALWYSESLAAFRAGPKDPSRGHLVLVTAEDLLPLTERSVEDRTPFDSLGRLFQDATAYALRLCIVDPVNAYIEERQQSFHSLRQRALTADFIKSAKRAGVNLWMTCEQFHDAVDISHRLEHLADTTIRLTRGGGGDTASNPLLEITKSRFQPQLPGKHRLLITSGSGLRVIPSLESFRQLLPVSLSVDRSPCETGIPTLSLALGPGGIKAGHVVVVAGPGKYKTVMGIHVLTGGWWPGESDAQWASERKPSSCRVLISDMPPEQMAEIARGACGRMYNEFRRRGLDFLQIPNGWSDAGEVLSVIRDEFVRRQALGQPVERVMVLTIGRLENTTPALRNNELFGVMLVRLFRSFGATAFLINGDERRYGASRLRDVVADDCDVRIEFHHKHYHEREQTIIQTTRTPSGDHSREFLCLNRGDNGRLYLERVQFRVLLDQDQMSPVPTRVYLLAETANHARYHKRVIEALQNFLNPALDQHPRLEWESDLLTQYRYKEPAGKLVDDVQVIQIDEFELPTRGSVADSPFYAFAREGNESVVDLRHASLRERIITTDGQHFVAVPYYFNCSFLAISRSELLKARNRNPFGLDGEGKPDPSSWRWDKITAFVQELENERGLNSPDIDEKAVCQQLVFSCPVYDEILETYNSFFFEILHSLRRFRSDASEVDALEWIGSSTGEEAILYFRRLNRISHRFFYNASQKPRALINRHWYNTLNQELTNWHLSSNNDLSIHPLPGNITTSGEWYLVAPSYSRSPEIALDIIRFLCNEDQENARRHEGVGLPTVGDFYGRGPNGYSGEGPSFSASPYCRLLLDDVSRMIRGAFRRSWIPGYCAIRSSISAHLRWSLELPSMCETDERQRVADIIGSLVHEIQTIYSHRERCKRMSSLRA